MMSRNIEVPSEIKRGRTGLAEAAFYAGTLCALGAVNSRFGEMVAAYPNLLIPASALSEMVSELIKQIPD